MKATLSAFALLSLIACGSAADNTPVEATREQRAQAIAERACTGYEKCNSYGSGQTFGTRADCVADYNNRALNLWPASECNAGRINDAKYQVCADRVDSQACSQGFFDSIAALDDCKSSRVCTDPAQ